MTGEAATARLKTFALILKYGHDLFEAKNFDDAAALAVNNSRILLDFNTASMIEVVEGKARVAAQYAQVVPNPHSRLAVLHRRLAESLEFSDEPLVLTGKNGLPEELAADGRSYFCLKLAPPGNLEKPDFHFIWFLEYDKEIPAHVPNTAKLLAASVSAALHYQKLCKKTFWSVKRRSGKLKIWSVILLVLASAMFIPLPESTTAEFVLKAPEISSGYAWFDGQIGSCLKQDGATVSKGEVIARYDSAQLEYRLALAAGAVREAEEELALEQQNAFTDETKLGKVKLLTARLETMKVALKEAQWYLLHAEITAPANGVLSLCDGRAEQLSGRAVRTGDRLFDVFGGEGMTAEIPVNERDSSVLRDDFTITLFLHTAPEKAIPAEVVAISQYPELTEQRTYCYKVRALLPVECTGLRYGMRGIAKLSGGRAPLGYLLFKSAVLYFRSL